MDPARFPGTKKARKKRACMQNILYPFPTGNRFSDRHSCSVSSLSQTHSIVTFRFVDKRPWNTAK